MCNLIKISRQRMVAVAQASFMCSKAKTQTSESCWKWQHIFITATVYSSACMNTFSYFFLSIWTLKLGLLRTNKTATVFVSQTPFPSNEGSKCEGCAEKLSWYSLGGNQANCLNKLEQPQRTDSLAAELCWRESWAFFFIYFFCMKIKNTYRFCIM